MSRSSSTSRRQALGVSALALLFAVGQASSFTHRLLVQHAVCAEHGELVHADGAPEREAVAEGIEHQVQAVPAAVDDHAHDHCLVTMPRREDLLHPSAVLSTRLPQAALVRIAVEDAVPALNGIELLLLAPKSSPPA